MSSTIVYQNINELINKKANLLSVIPKLCSIAIPQSKIIIKNMNQQQILAQVYSSLTKIMNQNQKQLAEIKNKFNQEIGDNLENLNSNHQQNQSLIQQEYIEQDQENNLNQNIESQIQNEHQNQDQIIDDQDQQDQDEVDDQIDQEAFDGQEDVGLYGEQLDEQMEDYENQGLSEDQKQFEQEDKKIKRNKKVQDQFQQKDQEDEGQNAVEDAFDHFRQVQLKNNQETNVEKNEITNQIQKLQKKIIDKKDWVLRGEVKAAQRPLNSLLEYDLQFNTGLKLSQQVTVEYNENLENVIKQRILDELFDDRVRYTSLPAIREHFGSLRDVSTEKSKQGLAQIYELQFKNYLGLGENKNDKLKTQILQDFKEVNYYLDSLSNFSFTPKPNINKNNNRKDAIITEQKTPITLNMLNGNLDQAKPFDRKFESEKQQNKKGKRMKNKRISRQRVKEQMRKKMNKKIQFGGMTKFEAKAVAKISKNTKATASPNIKYNKSSNFFKQMNKIQSKKPNANISKMKI